MSREAHLMLLSSSNAADMQVTYFYVLSPFAIRSHMEESGLRRFGVRHLLAGGISTGREEESSNGVVSYFEYSVLA